MARSLAWFIIGQFSFGLVIGVMVGLSFSPTVGSVISLLFAFIGGSILVLIKDRSEQEIAIIGMSVTFLSAAIIIGALTGIYLRVGPPAKPSVSESTLRGIDQRLSIEEITRYGVKEDYVEVLCTLIQSAVSSNDKIKKDDIVQLMEKGVDRKIILALLDADFDCRDSQNEAVANPSSKQAKKGAPSGFGLYGDRVREKLFGPDDPLPDRIATE